MTKVSNRAEFDRALEDFVARHLEQGTPCSLIICDIDFFKRINDRCGHKIGDTVLRTLAERLAGRSRSTDVLGRYGGEEFALLLPETELSGACYVAERLRTYVRAQPIHTECGELRVTVSVGVAQRTEEDTDPMGLLDRADSALYEAKKSGRDCVRCYERTHSETSDLTPQ